ncbi:MAG: hypothetical protein KDB82_12130 [Planctomycetes bacterium]|nr:hypothetical protein [Planctomycetota bacterium]
MKPGYARIFVRDLDAMVEFYAGTLGLPKSRHPSTGLTAGDADNAQAGFETGDCTLIPEGPARRPVRRSLSKRGSFSEGVSPPTKIPWGDTLAYFKDHEGNVLGLVDRPAN